METPVFFHPDKKMVKWLINHAKDRLVFDIGCGQGLLLEKFIEQGFTKVIGIDPMMDYVKMNMNFMNKYDAHVNLLPYEVSHRMVQTLTAPNPRVKILGLLCRPCHHSLLTHAAMAVFEKHELLYIGLKENLKKDLADAKYEILPHEGMSFENEIVVRILSRPTSTKQTIDEYLKIQRL